MKIDVSHGPEIPDGFVSDGQASAAADPDARIYLSADDGRCVARVALWWRETPGGGIGTIGGFSAEDRGAAVRVLDAAMDELRLHGCTRAVGPMNGNTWRSYRFAESPEGRKPFLLEPRNPAEYPAWWREAGFSELAAYSSSAMPLDGTEVVSGPLKARLLRSGLVIRRMDSERYDDELQVIHRLSLRSFSNNFLYTPLDEESFLKSYQKVKSRLDPDLVRIAERDGIPCGFVFGIPDLEAAAGGGKPAMIVKTLAVDPDARCAGLGSLLVDELHRIGRDKGYEEAIHALQHENNTSLKITGRHEGRVFRKYVVFSHPL